MKIEQVERPAFVDCDLCRGRGEVLYFIERPGSHPVSHTLPCPMCYALAGLALAAKPAENFS